MNIMLYDIILYVKVLTWGVSAGVLGDNAVNKQTRFSLPTSEKTGKRC